MSKKKKNAAAVALGRLGGSAKHTKPRGFAAMTKEKRLQVAASGGTKKASNRQKKLQTEEQPQ
jgi:hypothetical protein